MKTSLFLGTALTALLVTGMANAAVKSYIADTITGDKEKPTAVNSANAAEARFSFDDVTKKLCGHIKASKSTFVATASHIHTGKEDAVGPPVISMGGFTGELEVSKTLTADEITALEGEAYINIHTADKPDGELRSQLTDDGSADPPEECGGEADAGASSSSSSSSGSTSDAGTTGTSATPATTDDSSGCNASGSSDMGSGLAMVAGLGLVLAAASRKRNKKA